MTASTRCETIQASTSAVQTIRVLPVSSSGQWHTCLERQVGATVYHDWEWLRLMASTLHSRFIPLGLYQSGSLVGLAPLLIKQYGPYTNANWTPFPYLGPLVPQTLLARTLRALDHYQQRNNIGLIQLSFSPHAEVDPNLLRAHHYTILVDTTMVVDLVGLSEEALFRGLKSSGRQEIRHALREGVIVRDATEQEVCAELPAMLREVFARRRQPSPYPARACSAVWRRFHHHPEVRLATAWYGDRAAAVSITIAAGMRAYFWQGAGFEQYRRSRAQALLYWDAICWARERGYQALDMLGSPEDGIATYKLKFGATPRHHVIARRKNMRIAGWGHDAFGRLLQLSGLLTERFGELHLTSHG